MTDEIRAIGEECYIYRSSKTELVSADNKKRVSLSVTEYNILSFFIDNQTCLHPSPNQRNNC